MTAAFEASDTDGAWLWKDAYEASEAAAVLFLRKYGSGMLRKAGGPARYLAMLERLSALLPSHTRRSEESDEFQQFSTPLGLGFLMVHAAQLPQGALMLEPSAGTGLLAIHAEIAGATLALNELAEARHAVLSGLFPKVPVTRFNAEQIDDYLGAAITPATVVMNPPFSASPNIARTMRDATARHIRSALRRLPQGGRLVALTHSSHDPAESAIAALYREPGFEPGFAFTATVDGRIYARHGTSVDTRLTVIDRMPRPEPLVTAGHARTLAELLGFIESGLPPRAPCTGYPMRHAGGIRRTLRPPPGRSPSPRASAPLPPLQPRRRTAAELAYETREVSGPAAQFSDRIYEPYEVQSIVIAGAKPHPTKLVQSAAMASVRAPIPSYRPLLPSPAGERRRPLRRAARNRHLRRRSACGIPARALPRR